LFYLHGEMGGTISHSGLLCPEGGQLPALEPSLLKLCPEFRALLLSEAGSLGLLLSEFKLPFKSILQLLNFQDGLADAGHGLLAEAGVHLQGQPQLQQLGQLLDDPALVLTHIKSHNHTWSSSTR
jgi:hypothetical protein